MIDKSLHSTLHSMFVVVNLILFTNITQEFLNINYIHDKETVKHFNHVPIPGFDRIYKNKLLFWRTY